MTTPEGQSATNLKGKRGLKRLINATGYSIKGIRAGLASEAAFREECLLAVVLIPVALLLPVTVVEKVLLINAVLLLLLVEILNSAVEAAVDRVGMEIHPLAGRAKDMASAAVFFALLIGAVTWGAIALPAIWGLF
ncbi:diacylglycerol kinase [Sutterella sp.]|uniref:diacylglycerol kinase n=1 Tax=Sutterella sp. TaxID=1981025 RepID=UPI0026E01B8F|nr:diacylglycerol kinase [Sutterella sp.]MDO5530604.1 diacylglycerol kinase [Sutterella sp.]